MSLFTRINTRISNLNARTRSFIKDTCIEGEKAQRAGVVARQTALDCCPQNKGEAIASTVVTCAGIVAAAEVGMGFVATTLVGLGAAATFNYATHKILGGEVYMDEGEIAPGVTPIPPLDSDNEGISPTV